MTVSTTATSSPVYVGNDVTTAFPTTFMFLDNDTVIPVLIVGVVETDLVTGFTVTGTGVESGGTVTLTAPLATGTSLRIDRRTPLTQPVSIRNLGYFAPDVHEEAWNRSTMQIQELNATKLDRDGVVAIVEEAGVQVDGLLRTDLANPNAPYGSQLVAFLQAGTGAVPRTLQSKNRDIINARDFGVVADGVTDDTAALQAAVNYVSNNGGVLYIPAGVYLVNARIFRASSAKPFIIQGAGENATIIKRASNFNASVMEFRLSHNVVINDLTIDGNNALFSNGNHGLVIFDSDSPKVNRVTVIDWKNSGILVYAIGGSRSGARINDCSVFGMGVSPVGILISGMKDSGMDGCSAYGVDNVTAGADGYGLELKNECDGCFITNGYAQDCFAAAAFGEDIGVTAVKNSRVSVTARACKFAFACGRSENNHIDIIAEMAGAAAGEQVVDLQTNSIGNTVRVTTRDAVASKRVVRIRSGCTDNVVVVDCVGSLPASSVVALFDAGSERNTVQLARIGGAPMPASGYAGLVIDSSTAGNNTFRYSLYPRFESQTIASGVISIKDQSSESVIIDTEGAAATDDLDSINGPTFEGKVIVLRTTTNARDVVVKHLSAGGNIRLNGLADFTLDGVADTLTLRWNSALNQWCEVSRSNNA